MKTITKPQKFSGCALAFGNFDGVHAAHQKLISMACSYAKAHGLTSVAYTFDRHSAAVLNKGPAVLQITDFAEKQRQIAALSPDVFYVERLSPKFLAMSAEEFIVKVLVQNFGVKYIAIGYNSTFGKGGAGNFRLLQEFGKVYGFRVEVLEQMSLGGVSVSSTAVRSALAGGDIGLANLLLGRCYTISGKVMYGKKLGRTIGFPTINIHPPKHLAICKNGVYKTVTTVLGEKHKSMTNVGDNPTVNGSKIKVETFIFGLDENLYGKEAEIAFLSRWRDEVKFESVNALKAQISEDMRHIWEP